MLTENIYPEFQQNDQKFPDNEYRGPAWGVYLMLAIAACLVWIYYLLHSK